MSRRLSVFRLTNLRRGVQVLFLVAFFGLILWARSHTGPEPSPWLNVFFLFDPLLLITTFLTTHVLVTGLLLALAVIGMTFVFGRVFCGWICPLGTIHSLAGWVIDRVWPDRHRRDHFSPWQRVKYGLLIGALVLALFGSHWASAFDPLVLLYRSTATGLLPGFQWAVEEANAPLAQADNAFGKKVAENVTAPAYNFLRDNVWGGTDLEKHAFLGGGLILALFMVVVLLNAYRRRWWCRYVCPLGALLGVFALRPFLRRSVKESCNQCNLCGSSCHGAATEKGAEPWRPSECLGCLNCTDSCRRNSVDFTWTWPWSREPALAPLDLKKRNLLAAALGGLATLAVLRITPQARGKLINADLIRPPGARPEREFLQRCTGCGLCLAVCPSGGLQPTFLEAGLEGLWTPRLLPRLGPCEYECNRCTQVCPTQAIAPLDLEAKKGVRLGLATFDTTRCIPYAFGMNCGVCEECCPIPDKAIYVLPVEVTARNGDKNVILQPHVDQTKCTGCGKCENMCPYKDRPGIRVTSANESRTPERPFL